MDKEETIAQYIQEHNELKSLYVSMYEIAEQFEMQGGKLLCFDEIHKYSNWSQELKPIYDNLT